MRALTLLLALLMSPAMAQKSDVWRRSTLHEILQRGALRVGLEVGYAPFEMRDKKGAIIGFDADLARLMAKSMGVDVQFVVLDWNGIMPALLAGQCDIIISGMTITAQRNLWINFSDPYFEVGQTVVMRRQLKEAVKSWKDLNEATKYTVVTKSGTTAHEAIKAKLPRTGLRLFDTEQAALDEVLSGKADAFVYDLPFNAVQASKHKKKLVHLDQPFTFERLGWGIRKGDPDFLNWLNHFLAQIRGDGTYDTLKARWFESDAWQKKVK